MADALVTTRTSVTHRWPTALAVVTAAGAVAVMAWFDDEVRYFGPSIAVMAGIYLFAYALGRPWTAWIGYVVLSAVVTAFHLLDGHGVLGFGAPVGMSVVLVMLWLAAVAARRFTESGTFSVQTAGMLGFGGLTLVCAAVEPRWGLLLAGAGFLAHACWDIYHFRVDRVVNRPWSEFCLVVDLLVGVALLVVVVMW